MTDKQIIIDGVDVSGCEHFSVYSSNGCCAYFLENEDSIVDCKNYPNCNYKRMIHAGAELNIHKTDKEHAYKRVAELQKQLKAKEQECEKIKEDNATLFDKAIEARKECTDLKEQLFLLKIDYAQLKAENDELKRDNASLYIIIDGKNGTITWFKDRLDELEEEKQGLIKDWEEKKNLAYEIACKNEKLKQTLAEIKPILEFYANSKMGEEQPDRTYKIMLNGGYITIYDPKPAREALQKINEVFD